jgi:hypothetical protein
MSQVTIPNLSGFSGTNISTSDLFIIHDGTMGLKNRTEN